MQFPQADLRTKEDGEECEEFLAAEAQVVFTNHIDIRGFFQLKKMIDDYLSPFRSKKL